MNSGRAAIPFVKASACGNDFLLIDGNAIDAELAATQLASISRRICDRHNGVGADGVEWMYPHATADIEIRLINNDGSEAEISGNGTRCVAAYLCAERKKERLAIATGAGLKICTLTGRSESAYEFEAQMGEAQVSAELAVTTGPDEFRGIPVSMGNPHYVIFLEEFALNWREQAASLQRSSRFPHGVNIEMAVIAGKHEMNVRFFERGAGETQSSGTGSCASAVAAIASARAESPVRVHAPGGVQEVRVESGFVFLRGWAQLICRGEFFAG